MVARVPVPDQRAPWIGWAVPVRRGELPGLLWAFIYFFCLLCSYYVLRPVRDEMGVRVGIGDLQWLFTATFLAMLVAVPAFAALVARLPRRRFLLLTYLFFIACILGFFFWFRAAVAPVWAAWSFFVWLSVFNLFVVSVFWSFMVDLFDSSQAARLFGAIAAGGSAGAMAGPGLTALLAAGIGPTNLLPVAAGILALTLPCIVALSRWSCQRSRGDAGSGEQGLGGSLLEGVRAVARSRYLLGICVFVWLYTSLSTFLYFQQAAIMGAAIADSGTRTAVFAGIDLAVNSLTLLLQLLATARLMQWLGLSKTLALVPALVATGFVMLAVMPELAVLVLFQVVRRAGSYAITRPAREMLFTVIPQVQKYKAKNVIDTVVYRGGDALSGWVFAGLAALGLGLAEVALTAVPIAILWLWVGIRLGQRHGELR